MTVAPKLQSMIDAFPVAHAAYMALEHPEGGFQSFRLPLALNPGVDHQKALQDVFAGKSGSQWFSLSFLRDALAQRTCAFKELDCAIDEIETTAQNRVRDLRRQHENGSRFPRWSEERFEAELLAIADEAQTAMDFATFVFDVATKNAKAFGFNMKPSDDDLDKAWEVQDAAACAVFAYPAMTKADRAAKAKFIAGFEGGIVSSGHIKALVSAMLDEAGAIAESPQKPARSSRKPLVTVATISEGQGYETAAG